MNTPRAPHGREKVPVGRKSSTVSEKTIFVQKVYNSVRKNDAPPLTWGFPLE